MFDQKKRMTMKHNKKLYIALVAAPLIVLAACNKKFLDINPQGQLTETQALLDPDAANEAVEGIYNTLYFGGFGNTTVGFEWVMMTDVASDDGDKGSTPDDFSTNGAGDIDNFTVNSNNGIVLNVWNGHYLGIARANKAIEIVNGNTALDATTRNRLVGESRFLRGLFYFDLVRAYGGVVKVTRVPQPSELNNDEFQTRASVDTIYKIITDDLQFAADNLPVKGDASTVAGRANKGAAEAYLAKAYLYQKNWQKAFDLTKDIISSNLYSLVPDYNLVFRENPVNGQGGVNNSESIFEVQTGINSLSNAISPNFSNGQGPRGKGGWDDLGFGFNNPTQDLANAYEPGDTRDSATIIYVQPTGGANTGTILWDGFRIPTQDSVQNQRYNYKAYHSPLKETAQVAVNKDTKPKNIRLMRYSEVLLIYAEAAAMLGNSSEATAKLNMVRARANLGASVGTQANIWKERRVELGMEQDRFFDLVRQGRAGAVLRASGKAFVDGKNEVFPIPQQIIDLSGGRLKQNPNY
jgi:starch-binding outer membrane protein, SusD/RagB family